MNRRERLENKLAKRLEWADSREQKANSAATASHNLIKDIPFGQPVLVGHHSERRHRRTLERSQNLMFKMVEHNAMAEHHKSKAEGIKRALDRSIFSDDENAIAEIEARIAKRETERERNNAINKIIRKKPKNEQTQEKVEQLKALGLSEGAALELFKPDFCGRIGIPSYVNQNLGGNIASDRKRIEHIKRQNATRERVQQSETGVLFEPCGERYVSITFAEKPDREVLTALKENCFRWNNPSWIGPVDRVPDCVKALQEGEA